jgi:TP901 family phage tail tape measure protein
MSDVNAKIGVQIDTSQALAELKGLQRQLALFHTSVSKGSASAAAQQRNMQQNLLNSINATGKFSAQMGVVRTSTESFTHSLEKNKLSMREYFRFAGGSTKTFGRLFKTEFDTIGKVAQERVKKLQTQYIKLGRDASGAMKAISVTPTSLNMKDYGTQIAMAAQKQALFNQLLKQGSTNLLNFGKNTQWAGRQLMVGFTIPLVYLGTVAGRTFMDLEKQAIRFKRVYGDVFTTTEQTNEALENIKQLAESFTKYGVAVVDTMKMAADAAAMGKTGAELTAQVAQATRLAVLGGVEQSQALETTISVTNAFGIAAEDLAKKIDFLNAVENQTVVSIEDLTIAIPKAGPVVKQLGGDVEDLAFFLTAMKEGGINASEGANALKSGLASLINPTKKASAMLAGFGININAIVEGNQGNIRQTVIDFSRALDTLDPLNRARAIEQLFGKFQFSRLSTLFQNVTKDGTQASKVLALTTNSVEQLAIMSERELGVLENAVGTKFKKAIEDLKLTLAPIGKTFLEAVTPIAQSIAGLLDKFNNLGDGTKKFIVVATTLVGVIGPVLLMTFGLLLNAVANGIKLFAVMRSGFLRLGGNSKILAEQTNYLSVEQLEAATIAASLNQRHTQLTQQFVMEAGSLKLLRQAYIDATAAAARFAATNPGMMLPGFRGIKGGGTQKFSSGTTGVVGGESGKDSVPALLTPGEAVVPEPIAQDDRFKPLVAALVSGKIAQYNGGTTGVKPGLAFGHAVDYRQVSGANVSDKFRQLGFGRENLYTSVGFDIPKEMNAQLNRTNSRVNIDDYRKALLNNNSLRTMTLSLAKRGIPDREAYKVAQQIRGNLLKSLSGLPSGTLINDKMIYSRMGNERTGIMGALAKSGDPIISKAARSLLGAASTSAVGGSKIATNKLKPIDDVIKAVQKTRSNPVLVKKLNELKKLNPNLQIPTSLNSAGEIVAYRRPEITGGKVTGNNVMNGLVDGKFRSQREFLGGGRQVLKITKSMNDTFDRLISKQPQKETVAVRARGEFKRDSSGKLTALTGQNTERKPASVGTTSRNIADNRTTTLGPKETVVQRIRRIRGFADAQKVDSKGVPLSEATSKLAMGPRGLIAKQQQEIKKQNESIKQSTQATDDLTKQTKTAKQSLTAFSSKATMGLGAISGLTIAASFAGGKLGEMAQTIMPFVFGLQGIAMILPLLANPLVAVVAGFALVGGVIYKMGKDLEKARLEGINLAKSMSMTSEKLTALSVIAGTVSASEEAARRRKNIVSGTVEGQRQFGQNTLESEFGKGILADIEKQSKSGKSIKEISQNLANNLAVAVAQGAVTTSQARSISAALGEKLGSYEIPALVSGKLVSLLGPNGENLATDPLQVTLQIQKDSMQRQADSFRTAVDGAISESTGPNVLARVAGFGLIAAGAAAAVLTAGAAAVPGAALAATGAGLMLGGEADANKRKSVNVKLAAAAVELGIQEVAQNQGLVDSLNKQYDLKLKSAKTEQEIKTIEDQRKAGLATLNASNANALNLLVKQRDQLGGEAFTKGIKAAADAMYKEGPMAVFKDQALDALNNLKDSEFKTELQVGLASGQVGPAVITKILSTAAGNKGFETAFSLLVDKQGLADAALIAELLPSEGATDTTRALMLGYINNNSEDFDKDMQALSFLNQINPTYGITLDLKANGIQQLATATNALKQIEGLDPTLTKDVVAKLAEEKPGEWKAFYDQWTILSEGKDFVNKNLKVAFDVVSNDPNFKGFEGAAGKSAAEIIAKGGILPGAIPGGGVVEDKGPGKRDTVLDDLLLKLKLFRKESVNALGGWKELVKQLGSGKSINAFKGTTNQLQGMGANESLVQFAEGLGAEEAGKFFDKITSKAKNGKLVLNDYGKSLNRLFPTVQAGIYLRQQDQITREQTTQNKALSMLRARGVDAATALELTADAAQAAAIVSKDLDGKDLEKMIDRTKKATAATKEFEKALKATQFEADELSEGGAEALSENFDYQFIEIQKKAKDSFKKINGMSSEAIELSIMIDEQAINKIEDEINGINLKIKSYSRTLDSIGKQESIITETYDKKIESLNKQKDALESIKSINSFLISQQQKQLGLANALTQGDISAAASIAQEMRASSAEEALNRMGGGLEKATSNLELEKQKDLSLVTAVVNGEKLTRKQIDAKIITLNDEIYNIELKQLEPLQKQADAKKKLLSDLDFQISKEQQSLTINGMTRAEWDFIQRYTDATNKHLNQIVIDIDKVATSSTTAAGAWTSILASMKAASSLSGAVPSPTAKTAGPADYDKMQKDLTKEFTDRGIASGPASGLAASSVRLQAQADAYFKANPNIDPFTGAQKKMYGGKILSMAMGGLVPKYMANGGSIGSDTVPAMLTPGEFVMNKKATQQFGPLLSMLNESKYPSMIGNRNSAQVPVNSISTSMNDNSTAVYNYSLGFNINGSNSNPNDIARAVIREIKNVDSQRIRGQRI